MTSDVLYPFAVLVIRGTFVIDLVYCASRPEADEWLGKMEARYAGQRVTYQLHQVLLESDLTNH